MTWGALTQTATEDKKGHIPPFSDVLFTPSSDGGVPPSPERAVLLSPLIQMRVSSGHTPDKVYLHAWDPVELTLKFTVTRPVLLVIVVISP